MAKLKKYKETIDYILKDLGLQDVRIEWQVKKIVSMGKNYGGTSGTNEDDTGYVIELKRKVLKKRKLAINIIAHELRHIWQLHTGKSIIMCEKVADGETFYKIWKLDTGTLVLTHSLPYDERFEEIDANSYADLITRRCNTT